VASTSIDRNRLLSEKQRPGARHLSWDEVEGGGQQGGRGKRCVWLNPTHRRTGFWDGCHDLFDWVEWWHEEGGEKGSAGIRLGVMRKGVVKVWASLRLSKI
jgi:hypothetical protein